MTDADADTWQWVAIIAILMFCSLLVFLLGRRDKHSEQSGKDHGPGKGSLR